MALLSPRLWAAVLPRAVSIAKQPAVNAQTRLCASLSASGATDHDAALRATWQRCSTLLSASGSLGLSSNDPLHVMYVPMQQDAAMTSTSGLVTFPLPESAGAAAVQQLVSAASPSPFGKGKEPRFDPSVRSAVAIKASQLGLNKVLPPVEVGGSACYTAVKALVPLAV